MNYIKIKAKACNTDKQLQTPKMFIINKYIICYRFRFTLEKDSSKLENL